MEGRIVQKLECRPYGNDFIIRYLYILRHIKGSLFMFILLSADNCYMKLKLQSIKRASVPQRQVQQLDRVVQNFKPVSDHKHNVSIVFIIVLLVYLLVY